MSTVALACTTAAGGTTATAKGGWMRIDPLGKALAVGTDNAARKALLTMPDCRKTFPNFAQDSAGSRVSMGGETHSPTCRRAGLPAISQGVLTMEITLLFAGILVAVALAGDNLLGFLLIFAACQFLGSLAWLAAASSGKLRPLRTN